MRRVAASSARSSDEDRALSNLVLRVASAAVGVPLVLLVDYAGGIWLAAVMGIVSIWAVFELEGLLRHGGYHLSLPVVLPASVALSVAPVVTNRPQTLWTGIMVGTLVLSGAYFLLPGRYSGGLINWALTSASACYAGLMPGHLHLLRHVRDGAWWIVIILVITWAYDTGAFTAGSTVGKHPFMSHISASKTIEGVAGGLLFSALAGLLAIATIGVSWWQALLLGLCGGALAQVGDLVESMIKRQTGQKDSGTLIPGHGGLLDRIDSLLVTGVFGYYAAALLGYAS